MQSDSRTPSRTTARDQRDIKQHLLTFCENLRFSSFRKMTKHETVLYNVEKNKTKGTLTLVPTVLLHVRATLHNDHITVNITTPS